MDAPTKDNGKEISRKDMVYRSGQMGPNFKAIFITIEHQAKENFIILMGMYMKDNGTMIKPTEKENIFTKTDLFISEIGGMTISTDLEDRQPLMAALILDIMKMDKKMVKGNIFGLMEAHMSVNGLVII